MSFEIKLAPKVAKRLQRLDAHLSSRIKARLHRLAEDPFLYLERLAGHDCYKLRIGEYRALIDVDKKRQIVFVRHLDRRGRIYKRV